jgi:hypothetical protein
MSVPSFRWPQNSTSRLRPESNHFVNELWILIFRLGSILIWDPHNLLLTCLTISSGDRKECHLQNLLVCTFHSVFSAGFVQNLIIIQLWW